MSEISPLFAVDVEHLIRNGFYEDAILLCEEGLQEYPDYPAAIALLAKAYASLGDADKAQNIIDGAAKSYSAYKVIQSAQENINNNTFENIIEETHIPITEEEKSDLPFDLDSLIEHNDILEFDESKSEDNLENSDKFIDVENVVLDEFIDENSNDELIEEILNTDTNTSNNFDIDAFIEDEITEEVDNSEIKEIAKFEDFEQSPYISSISGKFDFASEFSFEKNVSLNASNPFSIYGISDLILDFRIHQNKQERNLNLFEIEASLKTYRSIPYQIYPELAFEVHHQAISPNQKSMYDDDYDEYAKPTVITETIANILYQQGAIDEAIEAYQKLAELHPEKFDYYQQKIEEINSIEFSINQ